MFDTRHGVARVLAQCTPRGNLTTGIVILDPKPNDVMMRAGGQPNLICIEFMDCGHLMIRDLTSHLLLEARTACISCKIVET